MATVRIGDFGDWHIGRRQASTIRGDLDYLINSLNSDLTVLGGDQCNGSDTIPHTPESQIRSVFEDVIQPVDGAEECYHLLGNHDIPTGHYRRIAAEYVDKERVAQPKLLQPVDGVSVMLIETSEPVNGGRRGMGLSRQRVPRYQLMWLREQLQAAHDRGDIPIVMGHSPLTFAEDSTCGAYHYEASTSGWTPESGQYHSSQVGTAYFVISNTLDLWEHVSDLGPFVYVSHHDFHDGAEYVQTETNSSGETVMHHIFQDHYADPNGPTTLGYLDVDTSASTVTYNSIESGSYSTRTTMEVQL